MQLTSEIKAKIFGLYIGQQAIFNNGIDEPSMPFTFFGVRLKNGWEIESPSGVIRSVEYCKLILTPLSEITDEDAIGAYDLRHSNMKNLLGPNIKIAYIKQQIESDSIDYRIADFLRSRGYALPYLNIDLFESGIAKKK